MDLTLSDEHMMLSQSIRAFVARDCPSNVVREVQASEQGFDRSHLSTLAELGVLGFLVPEEFGGSGIGVFDLTIVAEELGRGPLPSPLVMSSVLSARLLEQSDSSELRSTWLPRIASGTSIVTAGLLRPGARDEWSGTLVQARRDDRGLCLNGSAILTPYAHVADLLILQVCEDQLDHLVAIDPRVDEVVLRRQHDDSGEPVFEVQLNELVIGAQAILASGPAVRTILDDALNYATVISLALTLGCAQRALELSVEHAKNRVQFGRPIGTFQAIAHRCVDIQTDVDACRMLCYQAAWALDNLDVANFEVSAAKAYANMAIRRVFTNAHQILGAIGYSTEHDLPLYSLRGKTFELSFGSSTLHRERVAHAMGLTGSIDVH